MQYSWIVFLDDNDLPDMLDHITILLQQAMKIVRVYVVSKKISGMSEFYKFVTAEVGYRKNRELMELVRPLFLNEYIDETHILQEDMTKYLAVKSS